MSEADQDVDVREAVQGQTGEVVHIDSYPDFIYEGQLERVLERGAIYRPTGPAFSAVPFDPTKVTRTSVGSASITFADGNAATFAYTVNGVTQTKPMTRYVFRAPGTVCR